MESPDLSVRVLNSDGREVADLSIIGAHQQSMGLTIHLRGPFSEDPYTLDATIQYDDLGQVHRFSKTFDIVRESGNEQA
jgi:hypothetical protein